MTPMQARVHHDHGIVKEGAMTTKQSRHKYKNKKIKTIMVSKMPSHEIHISRIGTSA